MTLKNRDTFAVDPTAGDIPNLGVAKVGNPEDQKAWSTLEWELRSFVCEGEYERGLERILDQYLSHLGQDEQPAAWVSGFFGSGKSHLMKVLEYLWRNPVLPSGTTARDLARLTPDIDRHLVELTNAGNRQGGIWSAAGTMSSSAAGSVRLAFLNVIFAAAGLPNQYELARLALFLRQNGMLDQVADSVKAKGKEFDRELRNLYVSPILAQALIDAGASFGTTPAEVSAALRDQYPRVGDISDDEMLDTMDEVLQLQSTTPGKVPLTLVVLDEMQQYINDDNARALDVQHVVEGCSSRFDSQVLVVATGQAALTANSTLQKLQDRFSVTVQLSDTDVETVVRQVVLRKKPDQVDAIKTTLAGVSGEIDQHLGGTRLEAKGADRDTLVADYPLLPTRRRFFERTLRSIDKAGKAGVLRTQLKIVHEAVKSVADEPVGHVIGGDFVFTSEAASMQQSGVLLKEIDETIRGLQDGTPAGLLKSRICALIFLISQLPQDGVNDSGLRATAPWIADLLVEDLAEDGAELRKQVPALLADLVADGRVVKIDEQYLLQTEEGAEWTADYNRRRAAIRADSGRLATLRHSRLLTAVDAEMGGIKIDQGLAKVPRSITREWDDDLPTAEGNAVPVWFRDEWSVTDTTVKNAAATAGPDSPVVFVLLPKVEADAIRDALATHAAAEETVNSRPEPQTDEGRQAKHAMQSRIRDAERTLTTLFDQVVAGARVFQGGGNELTVTTLRATVQQAAEKSLVRQFSKFGVADQDGWGKVVSKVRDGASDALAQVGWSGEVLANPVTKEVLSRVPGGGVKGSEVVKFLKEPPYGWESDAIHGALLVLLANGHVRAELDSKAVAGPKELPPTQIGKATFYKEDEPPTLQERMAVRGALTAAGVKYTEGQEGAAVSGLLQYVTDLAGQAGGAPPLPAAPEAAHVAELQQLAGNALVKKTAEHAADLKADIGRWKELVEARQTRLDQWDRLNRLLAHATGLAGVDGVAQQRDAVETGRQLLDDPDPVAPLVEQVCSMLRAARDEAIARVTEVDERERAALESDDGWQRLTGDQQGELRAAHSLQPFAAADATSHDELLAALDARPLKALNELTLVIPARVQAARRVAAGLLEPEEKRVEVTPPSATLKSHDDVNHYVDSLRDQLKQYIDDDAIVII
ncbi:MAG: BREX system P-loop protein BrxC [Ilumatobacteraceae bacterium]|nr:BREX system P-loop protein BrxC [Ilumatobacteraceae bacterium]